MPDLDTQKRYWEDHWLDTKSLSPWAMDRARLLLDLLERLRLREPRILDLGCGTGWFAELLARFGPTTAVDLSDRAIAAAKLRAPHITWIAGNFFDIALPVGSFDVVVSQQVIAHVEDQAAYLDYAARALRVGGFLLLSTPNRRVIDQLEWPPEPYGHIEQWLTPKSLRRLLRQRFHVLYATSIIFVGHRGLLRFANSFKLNRLFSRVISKPALDRLKGRAGLGYTLVVLAQKRAL